LCTAYKLDERGHTPDTLHIYIKTLSSPRPRQVYVSLVSYRGRFCCIVTPIHETKEAYTRYTLYVSKEPYMSCERDLYIPQRPTFHSRQKRPTHETLYVSKEPYMSCKRDLYIPQRPTFHSRQKRPIQDKRGPFKIHTLFSSSTSCLCLFCLMCMSLLSQIYVSFVSEAYTRYTLYVNTKTLSSPRPRQVYIPLVSCRRRLCSVVSFVSCLCLFGLMCMSLLSHKYVSFSCRRHLCSVG